MIIEGVVTTWDANGVVNVAPLGASVHDSFATVCCEMWLRPFPGSQTYANLKAVGDGVFHITDDILLIAKAAVGWVAPPLAPCEWVKGQRLADCCRWYEFVVSSFNETGERPSAMVENVHQGEGRPWTGFNRAKHAVLEAAILATRLHLTGKDSVLMEFERLRVPITKTAGNDEHEAFDFLVDYVQRWRPT